MMPRALIVHASRHGATAGIAQRIGEVLGAAGLEVTVARAADMPDPSAYDACLVGAGVYMGSWVKEGTAYLDRYAERLAARPVWLFSSGPLPGSSKEAPGVDADLFDKALGPMTGPGSGGRRKLEALSDQIHPRGHQVFAGAFDPSDPPKAFAERMVRMMPAAKSILPEGDFRDWPAIEAWAGEIAAEVKAKAGATA
jgi:menaquinone-dependent protoporphyrinogen oxidase